LIYAVTQGWAVAASDMGTAPSAILNGDALIGHPEKWIDWGSRATDVMTTLAKDVIRVYYGRGPRYSYFNGCSTGGQQALMLAQRFPTYYDGILGGSPGHDRTHLHVGIMWIYAQTHKTAKSFITPDLGGTMTDAVVKACAVKSGGLASDNFLTDPRKCNWQPSALICTSRGQSNCLNADQVRAVSTIYAGARDSVTGQQIFPGSVKGSESGWVIEDSGNEPAFDSLFKWVFGPQWQWQFFDYHRSMADTDAVLAKILNADSTELTRFRNRGGKFIQYHGFADPLVSPYTSIDYYTRLVRTVGNGTYSQAALTETQKFHRLFMVPGMGHCGGGPGPNSFGNEYGGNDPLADTASYSALLALMRWVERGVAPDKIIGTKFVNDSPGQGIAFQRPLCPYPQLPHYVHGDVNAANSFVCQ
jgi:feruloyl esterase